MVDVWVCNSSPLISLARIQRIDLVESLAGEVVVPAIVIRELEAGSGRDAAARAVRGASRLRIVPDVEVPEVVRSRQLDTRGKARCSLGRCATPAAAWS